jgi:hypothetical protein
MQKLSGVPQVTISNLAVYPERDIGFEPTTSSLGSFPKVTAWVRLRPPIVAFLGKLWALRLP